MSRHWLGKTQTVLVATLILISFGLDVSAAAFTFAEREAETKRAMGIVANRVRSAQELTFYGVLAGIKPEAMRKISGDIETRSKGNELPKVTMVKGEFFLNGEASGVRVFSYAPLSLSFHRKKWTYEHSAGPEENYTALVNFLSEKTAESWTNFLIPSAHAAAETKNTGQTGHDWPVFVGMIGGITIAVAVGAITGVDEGMGVLLLLGLVTGTGSGLAASNHLTAKDNQMMGNLICSSHLEISQCDANGVKLKISTDKRELFMDTTGTNKGKLYLKDANGNRVPTTSLTNKQADLMDMVQNGCKYGGSDFKPRWESAVKTACGDKRNEMRNDQHDPEENGPDGNAGKAQ